MARDYPNMSYCAFENTNAALAQLTAIVDRAIDYGMCKKDFVDNMSEYEQQAFSKIRERMANLITILDELDGAN